MAHLKFGCDSTWNVLLAGAL